MKKLSILLAVLALLFAQLACDEDTNKDIQKGIVKPAIEENTINDAYWYAMCKGDPGDPAIKDYCASLGY